MSNLSAPHRTGRPDGSRALGALAALATLALVSACASAPPHYPSATAQAHIGKSLFNLEMRWSTPEGLHDVHGAHVATWRFNQYNYAGCSVTVHTDRRDIIRKVTWTKGCGPKVVPKVGPATATKR